MAKTVRIKRTHKFQLDIHKDLESWLHEWIPILTQQRKFSQYVRDGLRLMIDLSAGNVDVLIELFPWVSEKIAAGQGSQSPPNNNELDEIKGMLEHLLAQQKADNGYHLASLPVDSKQLSSGQNSLAAPKNVAPVAEIKVAVAASADTIADNFLSMFN